MNFFGLGSSCAVGIKFSDQDARPRVPEKNEMGDTEMLSLFSGDEPLAGEVSLSLKPGSKLDHLGIKVEVIGHIENYFTRAEPHVLFSLVKELKEPGSLTESEVLPFEFAQVDKEHESYSGVNVRLRYFVRVKISRAFPATSITKYLDFAVRKVQTEPTENPSVKMEVGIEDCMHIEFDYAKSKYHLQDVVIGKVFFLLVRIKIKHMELVIMRKENTGGNGPNANNDSKNLAKFEIMDGAPVRGESVPIRLFLKPHDLTPSYTDVAGKFSVKYLLNLVLVDEEDRRYFKAQEITLWRKDLL